MKNLLIYINPSGISKNAETLARIQIENILELGWKQEDIIFITNFPYEFMGVRAFEVDNSYFFADDPASIKCYTMAKLFENDLIFKENELYWLHDLDHFQQLPFNEEEIVKEMGDCDFALCDYGRRYKFNCGSIFFRKSAGDIFKKIRDIMVEYRSENPRCEEERALMVLFDNNKAWAYRSSVGAENEPVPAGRTDTAEIKKRIHKMPITYNFADYNFVSCWRMCDGKPKTAHFNPFFEKVTRSNPKGCKLSFFMGENRANLVLMTERLIKIFNKHGLYGNTQIIDDLNALEIKRYRRVWKPFMEKYGIKNICEVGVFASQNFKRFLEGNPQIAVGVDAWIKDGNPAHNDNSFSQEQLNEQCEYFKSLMTKFPSVRLYRQYSDEAAKNFPDEYFDLIYIDADHSYEGCKKDLEAWWPKVKKGKFFIGDDYSEQHAPVEGVKFEVIRAVDEFAKNNNLVVYKISENGWTIIK